VNPSESDDLPSAPAALRNRDAILDVLRRLLGPSGTLLEVASGLGDHAAHFSEGLPEWTIQPSDLDAANRAVISKRVRRVASGKLLEPLELDAAREPWPVKNVDAVFCANMIHISPWSATEGLFQGAASALEAGALLVTYGPYSIDGQQTAPSNVEFDAWLKRRDPSWGVRDIRDLENTARLAGFELEEQVPMPANNFCLVWRRQNAPSPNR
jgi:hypothetical protein